MTIKTKVPKSITELLSGLKMSELGHDTSDLLPVGQYKAVVDKLSAKVSADGDDYLTIQFRLKGNERYDNKPLWADFHLFCKKSEQARTIAGGQMRALLATAGMVVPEGDDIVGAASALPGCSTEFYVSQTQARTDSKTGRTYPPQNRIASYVMPMLAVA